MATIWQQLGAFVVNTDHLSDEKLEKFSEIGGSWIVPVIYGDNDSGPTNLANIKATKTRMTKYNISVGGWFNCWGGDPSADAKNIKDIVVANDLSLVILDCEDAYHYPEGKPQLLPNLVKSVREVLPPPINIGVSTNSMNNSMIWNGRTLTPKTSFYDLGIRCLPQWYTWMYNSNAAFRPDINMEWLKFNGATDPNFIDENAKTRRGLPLSYVHGTLEATGVENSDMADELRWLARSLAHGYSLGFSIYPLENTPDTDFDVIKEYRGVLYV